MKYFLKKHSTKITLALILLTAFFLRSYDLQGTPPGLYPDEAVNANNAIEALGSGEFKIFYDDNNGREGLFINLIALSFYLLGIGVWQLKFVGALFGSLTILVSYFLTRELFKSTKYEHHSESIALLSSFFIATSFWHLDISRLAFRAGLVPFLASLGILLLLLAIRKSKWQLYLLSGVVLGLGLYSYTAFLVIPLLLLLVLSFQFLLIKKEKVKKDINKLYKNIAIFFISFMIIALPIFSYFAKNTESSTQRQTQISVLSSQTPFSDTVKNTKATLLQFNIKGDCNQRHNHNCQSQLFWLVGIFFLVGIFYSLKNIRERSFFVLVSWFFLSLFPAIFSNEGIPHALRSVGALIPAYIFSGFGVFVLYDVFKKKLTHWQNEGKYHKYIKQLGRIKKEFFVLFLTAVFFTGYIQAYTYFDAWRFDPKTLEAFDSRYQDIADLMNSLEESSTKYIIVNTNGVWVDGVPIQAETIKFKTRNVKNTIYLKDNELEKISLKDGDVVIPMDQNVDIFRSIIKDNPGGKIDIQHNTVLYKK